MIQPLSCPHPRQPGRQLNWTKFRQAWNPPFDFRG